METRTLGASCCLAACARGRHYCTVHQVNFRVRLHLVTAWGAFERRGQIKRLTF